jgi:hypothetical protein
VRFGGRAHSKQIGYWRRRVRDVVADVRLSRVYMRKKILRNFKRLWETDSEDSERKRISKLRLLLDDNIGIL